MMKHRILCLVAGCLLVSGCQAEPSKCPQVDNANAVYASGVYADGVVAFRATSDPDNPLGMMLYRRDKGCQGSLVTRYSVEGSAPHVEHVFDHVYHGKTLLLVIVSWKIDNRGAGVHGKLYQVYAYERDGKGGLTPDQDIVSRNDMTGIEGVDQNAPSHFYGKTPAEVIKLLGVSSGT